MSYFPTTVWTMIRDAGARRATAVNDFVAHYRGAVVRFARIRGLDEAEAEDVAQEVLLRVFDDRVLERADAARGRFRSLLLAVTRNVLGHHFERKRAQKRGGGARPLSLDRSDDLSLDVAKDARDPEFDREWLASLLEAALRRLSHENPEYYRCLDAFAAEGRSHREIAAATGKTEAMVRNLISRGKAKLARLLRDQVAAYSSSESECADELRYLSGFLGERAGKTS